MVQKDKKRLESIVGLARIEMDGREGTQNLIPKLQEFKYFGNGGQRAMKLLIIKTA